MGKQREADLSAETQTSYSLGTLTQGHTDIC